MGNYELIIYNDPKNVNKFIVDNKLLGTKKYESIYLENIRKIDSYESLGDEKNIAFILDYYGIERAKEKITNNEIAFNHNVLKYGHVCTLPHISNNKLINSIYFPIFGVNFGKLDKVFIHELLHVADEHIYEMNEKSIKTRGGFETMTLVGDEEDDERKYEFLNELVHHKMVDEISKIINSKRMFIFDFITKGKSFDENNINDNCVVVDEFYVQFRKYILPLKLKGDIEQFRKIVGTDNFEALSNWCYDFYMRYYSPEIRANLNSNISSKEDDLTIENYHNDMRKGLIIIDNMKKEAQINNFL
jgi:hypothetical protein